MGLLVSALAGRDAKQSGKKPAVHRANELTLAGLRPGRDKLLKATQLIGKAGKKLEEGQTAWYDDCRDLGLQVDSDKEGRVQVIRAIVWNGSTADCAVKTPSLWKTGLGLRIGDAETKVIHLYGEPDSRSPSTKNGQSLELLYYAFDWAGEEVPQVMEVLCTKEADGKPGRVVEIMLAAPSL